MALQLKITKVTIVIRWQSSGNRRYILFHIDYPYFQLYHFIFVNGPGYGYPGGRKGKSWWNITFDSSNENEEEDAGVLTSFWKKFSTGVKKRFANIKSSLG